MRRLGECTEGEGETTRAEIESEQERERKDCKMCLVNFESKDRRPEVRVCDTKPFEITLVKCVNKKDRTVLWVQKEKE